MCAILSPLYLSPILSHTQQQYKFVYMAVRHYVESQQALGLMKVCKIFIFQ